MKINDIIEIVIIVVILSLVGHIVLNNFGWKEHASCTTFLKQYPGYDVKSCDRYLPY